MSKIVKYPDPILSTPTIAFDFNNTTITAENLAVELMVAMNEHNGIGLAANQIGYPYSVFAMRGHPENLVCFNPMIVYASADTELLEEGCLSFPGVSVKVKRPKEIRVRFQTPSGLTTTETFSGLTARTFQHEYDHLQGNLFINRANRYHREKAMKGYYNV